MGYPQAMHIDQALGGIRELRQSRNRQSCAKNRVWNEINTSCNRSALLRSRYWTMFPLFIHSDTVTYCLSFIVTPINGNIFGWRSVFQVMTSLQNRCIEHGQTRSFSRSTTRQGLPTFLIFSKSSAGCTFKALAATALPSCWPFQTSADLLHNCGVLDWS